MKHVKGYAEYRKYSDNTVNEMVTQIDDIYTVTITHRIPKKLISAYCKKVEQNQNKKLTDTFGDMQIAEMLAQYALDSMLSDVEKIPSNALTGGAQAQAQSQTTPAQNVQSTQAQAQPAQGQTQAQPAQGQTQAQTQPQSTQAQPPAQNDENFEDVKKNDEELPL
jgi:hypothetical protein